MTESLTRDELLRRGARRRRNADAARRCSQPAAAAVRSKADEHALRRPRRCRRRSRSRTGRSTSTSTRRRRSTRRSTRSTKKYGVKVKYLEDINDNDTFFGKIEGPLSQGQSIGRDIIVLTDSSGLPGPDDRARLAREARQVGAPEHQEPAAACSAPELGPEPRVQPAVAVGHDRASATTRRRSAATSRRSTSCSRTRSSRARSRCSPSSATRWAS